MLGYESDEELMRCDVEKDICRDPETHQRLIRDYWRKQDFRDVEAQWRRKDGKIITVKMTGHPVLEKADSPADRKSTRLNSSHQIISYAVFCLKKKNIL